MSKTDVITKLGNSWVMTSVWVVFVFAVVQLCAAEYVENGWKMILKDNLSLSPNFCHHTLITQLNINQFMSHLGRATHTVLLILSQTSQEGIN